jgi:LysM repeat protein
MDNSNPPPLPGMSSPSNTMPTFATGPGNSGPGNTTPGNGAQSAPPQQPQQQLPVIPMPPQQTPDQITGAASTYAVVAGDTLGKIAKAHGVTLKALETANPGVDPKKLKVKQSLNIPAPTVSAPATDVNSATAPSLGTSGGESYVVKSGDTLSKIAKRHGVTLKALRAANASIASTDHIKVGDKLTIPAKAETAAPTSTTDTSATPMTPVAPQPNNPAPGTPAPSAAAPGH